MSVSTNLPIIVSFILLYLIIIFVNKGYSKSRWLLPLNLLTLFGGASLAFMPSKIPIYLTIILMLVSLYYTYFLLEKNAQKIRKDESIVTRSISLFSSDGKFTKWFPLFGLFIAFVDLVSLKWFYSSRFGRYDFLVITLALTWFFYNNIPARFNRERDFLFIFFNMLVAILILPEVAYDLIHKNIMSESESDYGGIVMFSLLTKPLENILTLTGYEASAHGQTLSYLNNDGTLASVHIAEMCSGLYSFAIFSSALIAFFGTEYHRFHSSLGLLMILGILVTYFANLLRMFVIILSGHYWGNSALFWAHNNVGWIIFLIWNGLFWFFLINYTTVLEQNKQI